MKTKTVILAVVCLAVCGAVFDFLLPVSFNVGAEERIRIGISTSQNSRGIPTTVIAEKKGFFKKYALIAEHIRVSSAIGIRALATGDLDYCITGLPAVSAAIRGVPVKFVMITTDGQAMYLIVKPDVRQVADLRGKAVGISYVGSTSHRAAENLFRKHDLAPGRDVKLVPSGDHQARLAALDAGVIDAAVGVSPFNLFAEKRGYRVLARVEDYATIPQGGLVVNDDKLQHSPDQVKRVIKGTIEALQFIRHKNDEAIDILAQWMGVPRSSATEIFQSFVSEISADGTVTDKALQALLNEALQQGKVGRNIQLSQIADRRLLTEAQKELGF